MPRLLLLLFMSQSMSDLTNAAQTPKFGKA